MTDHPAHRITLPSLFRDAWQLISNQYGLFLVLTFALILVAAVSPLGVFLGPILGLIFAALKEKKNDGRIRLANVPKWLVSAVDGLLAYMMQLASCFLFLAPSTLLLYYLGSNWQAITANLSVPGAALIATGLAVAPTITTIQITLCLPFLFTYCELAQGSNHAVDAIKKSIQITTQNPTVVFKVAATLLLIHVVATACLILPAILFLPLHFSVIYELHQKLRKQSE